MIAWSSRLLGLAVFGPHMYWVGKRVEALEAAPPPPPTPIPAPAAAPDAAGSRVLGGASGGGGGSAEGAEGGGEEDESLYVLENEGTRRTPRRRCEPNVRCAYRVSAMSGCS